MTKELRNYLITTYYSNAAHPEAITDRELNVLHSNDIAAYKAGYEAGQLEWYYPSRGEYPSDEFTDEYVKPRLPSAYKRIYCLCLGDDYIVGKYIRGLFWTLEGNYSLSDILAWKEIKFPKVKFPKGDIK